jgi:hypothetical protein
MTTPTPLAPDEMYDNARDRVVWNGAQWRFRTCFGWSGRAAKRNEVTATAGERPDNVASELL